MTIIRDAVRLRLNNPWIQYEFHTAKAFTGIVNPQLNMVGSTMHATRITPNEPSFSVLGQTWYDVTPGSGGAAELIFASGMTSILAQPGVPAAQRVNMGRWAITELRLVTTLPVLNTVGRFVAYDFEAMGVVADKEIERPSDIVSVLYGA